MVALPAAQMKNPILVRVGTFMKTVRKSRGHTRETVAAHFGYVPSWISNIENGLRSPSVPEFFEWIEFMALTDDEWAEVLATCCYTDAEIEELRQRRAARKRTSGAA